MTVEGMEGTGKSTLVESCKQHCQQKHWSVFVSREPGGTFLGNGVRELLLKRQAYAVVPMAELLLIQAARAQHVIESLLPALANYDLVISDRYTDSSLAYQGGGRQIDKSIITNLNQWATQGLVPDLTVVLDMDPKEAIARALKRMQSVGSAAEDRFEHEALAFHQRVREVYQQLVAQEPERFLLVQAQQPPAKVFADVQARLEAALSYRRVQT